MSKIVKRTLDFFELFAEHQRPLSLSEISRLLDIPVSSCHDVLQSLQERGYLYELGPRGGYYPTLRLHRLAGRIADNDPVLLRAEIKLRALRDRFDESVSLARMHDAQATYLLVFEPSHALRFLVHVGEHVRALHCTSAGKAVLGALPPAEREKAYREIDFVPFTDKTVKTLDALRAEVDASLARGWFANREESVPGATTASCRFVWNRSTFIVTVAGPTFRMEPKFDDVVAELIATCQALEAPA